MERLYFANQIPKVGSIARDTLPHRLDRVTTPSGESNGKPAIVRRRSHEPDHACCPRSHSWQNTRSLFRRSFSCARPNPFAARVSWRQPFFSWPQYSAKSLSAIFHVLALSWQTYIKSRDRFPAPDGSKAVKLRLTQRGAGIYQVTTISCRDR